MQRDLLVRFGHCVDPNEPKNAGIVNELPGGADLWVPRASRAPVRAA